MYISREKREERREKTWKEESSRTHKSSDNTIGQDTAAKR